MALDLRDVRLAGPALPEAFVALDLERQLERRDLLPKTGGHDGRGLAAAWAPVQRKLRALGDQGGDRRVANHVLEPLLAPLGYRELVAQGEVATREGDEPGGWRLAGNAGAHLRAWAWPVGTDLDAPHRRGRAYRFSPERIAHRVLAAAGERAALLTDGEELRLLLREPALPDSHLAIRLDRTGGWRAAREVPDSFRLLLALASPRGVSLLPDLVDAARLAQSGVTRRLRLQARAAVERFAQSLLDHPDNADALGSDLDSAEAARSLWQEGLVLVYRLLFVLKLESSPDPARAFSFAATSLWRTTYSPNLALAPSARAVLDDGAQTGRLLEDGLRTLFRVFATGLRSSELHVHPLGGALFGEGTTPWLDRLAWGERAVAGLLDDLLWTPAAGRDARARVHYGALDVEDLGRVYEALLELEPGLAREPMCRLRRGKLEVVVPSARGLAYRPSRPTGVRDADDDPDAADADDAAAAEASGPGRVRWIEEIPTGRFYLRVGLGRKASGSYYTPRQFVRFLVQETLAPQVAERSPPAEPEPAALLDLKVLDPAMGSGHFLVEACRFLGDALYEACRACDELAAAAEEEAAATTRADERDRLLARAEELRRRVAELPDPNDELVAYLPSRAAEGEASGLSQRRAEAVCRRLVAVHCLYGVDKNPLAVELAKLSLWLESYAEGWPLTFLDHRLVLGDSLTGPTLDQLFNLPRAGTPLGDDLLSSGLREGLQRALGAALARATELAASVGKDVADLESKRAAKEALDAVLEPFRQLAAVWAGGVMRGDAADDAAYAAAVTAIVHGEPWPDHPALPGMARAGGDALAFALAFPEVFHRDGDPSARSGFDAIVGNPPWDRINVAERDFWSQFDVAVLEAPTRDARRAVQESLATPERLAEWRAIVDGYAMDHRLRTRIYVHQTGTEDAPTRGSPDLWRLFVERFSQLRGPNGLLGFVVPSSFHANEGALGVRAHLMNDVGMRCVFSFENHQRRFFDIDARFKFDLVVAGGQRRGDSWEAAFYLRDAGLLFGKERPGSVLYLTPQFVQRTGGTFLTFAELTSQRDVDVLATMSHAPMDIGELRRNLGLDIRQEVNITRGADAFVARADVIGDEDPRVWRVLTRLLAAGYLTVDDDKTFHQYTDRWPRWMPRYLTTVEHLSARSDLLSAARHYRIAVRKTTGGRNERTGILCLLPPGHVATDKCPAERRPDQRPNAAALSFLGLANAFPFDWLLRLRVQTDLNMFMLDVAPAPRTLPPFLAHAALRLSCNHAGYETLWREQLGDAWREPAAPFTWPVLAGDDARWAVRAAIDAVVADAYGLAREQYAHVLGGFTHRSYPAAPDGCLAAFDELRANGLAAFLARHDPYHDVPLVTALPRPAIELPIPAAPNRAHGGARPSAQPDLGLGGDPDG